MSASPKPLQQLEPATLIRVLAAVASNWAEDKQYWVKFLGMSFQRRLQAIFSDLATRFGVKESRGTLLTIELGQHDLAEMIGSSRPIVSQLIAKMRRAGKLEQRGKHYLILHGSRFR